MDSVLILVVSSISLSESEYYTQVWLEFPFRITQITQSCFFHIAQNVSHGTGNLFLIAHEPLSDIHDYLLKIGKEVKDRREEV